jgi:hypothetical protein
MTRPLDMADGAARSADGPRDARGRRRKSQQPRGPRWGALQGGLGVCIIVGSAAIGAIATIATRSEPGFLLGLLVVAGTAAAALAVRPRAGWMILPVPVLSYLVAALVSGVVSVRSASSLTDLAIHAAQWVADGFFAMVLATVVAVAIVTARWYLWRRRRPARRDPGRPVPAAGSGRADAGRAATGRRAAPSEPGYPAGPEPGYPAGQAGPAGPRDPRKIGKAGGAGGWGDAGPRGTDPRPGPFPGRPGPGPYNFSSGA